MSDYREQARNDIETLTGIKFSGDNIIIYDQYVCKEFFFKLVDQATNQLARARQSGNDKTKKTA